MKTDSWLIRTLNNASIVGKQKQYKDDVDPQSLESSNNSEIADIKLDQIATSSTADNHPATIIDSEYPAISSREHISGSFSRNDETSTKESESYVGRATYSETVRRSVKPNNILERKESSKSSCTINSSTATVIPIPGRKCQRKDPEQSYQLLHKSRRSADKKAVKSAGGNDFQLEEGSCGKVSGAKSNNVTSKFPITVKTHRKKDSEHSSKDKCTIKSNDRGWSVWYSSRRKQSLSPLALSKLEMIHQTVWQMDEAKIFKYPLSCDNKDGQSLSAGIVSFSLKKIQRHIYILSDNENVLF